MYLGLRDRFSSYLVKRAEKSGWLKDVSNSFIRWPSSYVNDDDVLQSSDVYELLTDISNQIAMAKPVIIAPDGSEIHNHWALDTLRNPNGYLSGSEFSKLEANTYFLQGNVYPLLIDRKLYLVNGAMSEIDENLNERITVAGTQIPGVMIEHLKNVGTNSLKGVGLIDLGKNTLNGVSNAEKVLTDKYAKGGLLAFLLKLDTNINPKNSAQQQIVDAILDQMEGVQSQHQTKMLPLGKGYSIETLKSPIEDDKILAYLNVYKKDLGKYLGINVDTYQAMMKSDIEKAMMYIHNKTVKPFLKNRSEHYSRLFFGANSKYRIEWRVNILDFVSYSNKTNIAYNLVRTMVTTPDDARVMLGFDPIGTDAATKLYVSKDLVGADDLPGATGNSLPTDNDSTKGGEKDAKNNGDSQL